MHRDAFETNLLISDDGGLLEDLHGINSAFVVSCDFSNLENFAIASLAKNFA
jgi:hypothetical protein